MNKLEAETQNAERTRKAAEEFQEMMVRDEIDIGEAGTAALPEHDADQVKIPFMLYLLKHDDSH